MLVSLDNTNNKNDNIEKLNRNIRKNVTLVQHEFEGDAKLIVYNSVGKVVHEANINSTNTQFEIKSETLGGAGMYMLVIANNSEILYRNKLIIAK